MSKLILLAGLSLMVASHACAEVKVEKMEYKGWRNCYRVSNGEIELVVTGDVGPRVGLAYSLGKERQLVIRAGFGLFYTRIPQIYTSAIQSENGLAGNFLFLNNNNFADHQIFPQYPNPLVSCPVTATNCQLPSGMAQLEQADVSAFSHNFKTPRVQ